MRCACLQHFGGFKALLPGAFAAVGCAVAAGAQNGSAVLAVELAVGEIDQVRCLQRRVPRAAGRAYILQHRGAARKIQIQKFQLECNMCLACCTQGIITMRRPFCFFWRSLCLVVCIPASLETI